MQMKIFKTVLFVIFWQVRVFQSRLSSPQVKQDLRHSKIKFVDKLPHDLKIEILGYLGNIKKF